MAKKLEAIQRRCLRVVTGAYKATSTEALEAETQVQPLNIYLNKLTLTAAKGIEKRVPSILRGRGR